MVKNQVGHLGWTAGENFAFYLFLYASNGLPSMFLILINAFRPNAMHVEQRILHQRQILEAANFSTQVVNLPTETGLGEASKTPRTQGKHTT